MSAELFNSVYTLRIKNGLPAPSPRSVVGSVIEETDVLEEEVKPKASQIADVEKPQKKKKPVKITIPALPDDDDEPAKKKLRTGGFVKSGLASILPPPVHAAKKEANRILLPYSLTKKPDAKPKPPPPSSTKSVTNKAGKDSNSMASRLADYGSDSDDDNDVNSESANFFSLDSDAKNSVDVKTNTSISASSVQDEGSFVGPALPPDENTEDSSTAATVPLPPGPRIGSLHLPSPVKTSANIDNVNNAVTVTNSDFLGQGGVSVQSLPSFAPAVDADAPLTFKGGVSSRKTTVSRTDSVGPSLPSADNYMYSNMAYTGGSYYPEADSLQAIQQDNDFLRLQGKQQRGKEEINIIDVNADDYTDPSEITKHLTEEQTYQSHSKKDGGPTSQQKRKHQIGYLAFQAKERELELKNQWSQNKQTRKQTQAKYGF